MLSTRCSARSCSHSLRHPGSLEKEEEATKPFNPGSYLLVSRLNCAFNAEFSIFKNIANWFP